ncbi:MAG TPA: TonB-dependent receptor [Permianibacter sp.]|nr:TonB-dependent receptor [Permianibacter sp.]
MSRHSMFRFANRTFSTTALTVNQSLMALAVAGALLTPFAANAATVRGQLLDANQKPVANARIRVPALNQTVQTDRDGRFELQGISAGNVLLDIEAGRHGHLNREIAVGETDQNLTVQLDDDVEHVVVNASALEHRTLEMATPAQVLAGDDLLKARGATLGETLDNQPGVSASSFGAGSSRPVIRGLGGARVQMLQDGVGTLDASTVSADHNVAAEPLTTEQIEVLRGPATLLYGSGAIGGVVNVIDRRIPETRKDGIEGAVELRGQTANNERSVAAALDGGSGDLAFHLNAFTRETDDIEIPGDAERFPDAEEGEHAGEELAHGTLENSSIEGDGGSIGASWIGERGFIGIALSAYNSNYGVPGHHAHHEEVPPVVVEEEPPVRIDLEQRRTDLKARLDEPLSGFEALKLRIGRNDYEHVELEGEEVGTSFENAATDTRLELVHKPLAGMRGVIGVQVTDRDFTAIGEEAFVPPSTTESNALFLVEERELGKLHLEGGIRYEQQKVSPESAQPRYDDSAFSWSVGGVYDLGANWSTALSYAHAERMPSAEELYSDGPHVATQSYEIGDVNLGIETANNIDLSLRYHGDSANLNLSLYRNAVSDFIYASATGAELDELPVFQYFQADATLQGIELAADWTFFSAEAGDWILRGFYDQTTGELDDGGDLPRIPPERLGLGLDFDSGDLRTSLDVIEVAEQDDVTAFETETDGYTLVNAGLIYRVYVGDHTADLFLRGSNLLDEDVRLHTSFLKDIAPQMGRSWQAGVRFSF